MLEVVRLVFSNGFSMGGSGAVIEFPIFESFHIQTVFLNHIFLNGRISVAVFEYTKCAHCTNDQAS